MAKSMWFSVDIEASGPAPGVYSMLSVGACVVDHPEETFYAELQPISDKYEEAALKVAMPGKTHASLYRSGEDPQMVMIRFCEWVEAMALRYGGRPTFVAHNAPFDWMFVAWYLWRYVGRNPFGWDAVDTRALFMGHAGVAWEKTRLEHIKASFPVDKMHKHHALYDALEQGELFAKMMAVIHAPKDASRKA